MRAIVVFVSGLAVFADVRFTSNALIASVAINQSPAHDFRSRFVVGLHVSNKVMIKDLVVNLAIGSPRDVARDYAISIARTFEADLAGIAFNYEPGFPGAFINGVATGLIEEQRTLNERAAKTAIVQFVEAARAAGVKVATHLIDGSFGGAATQFGKIARRFNLSVVAQSEGSRGAAEDLLIEAALFESGRPVIIVPYIQREGLSLERVVVCWDGSKSAARATADAMPFLERARKVTIFTVLQRHNKHREPQGADIADHLKRYGISLKVEHTTSDEVDVASTILSFAADAAADLLVMGGYGHSRMREFVLGGVTRGMLKVMTVPTLMAH